MVLNRVSSLFLAGGLLVAATGFGKARMEVPPALAGASEVHQVSGHNPRTWNRPLAFGPYRTQSVQEGLEFSWSVEALGIRGGRARQRYRLVVETPAAGSWEVECISKAIEVWRDGWSVELTDAFRPRLACGLWERGGEGGLRLVLGSNGRGLRGAVEDSPYGIRSSPLFQVRSVDRLEGTRLRLGEPAGYALEQAGRAIAAVETINRGRVWLASDLSPEMEGPVAAAVAALLLYKPELSPQD